MFGISWAMYEMTRNCDLPRMYEAIGVWGCSGCLEDLDIYIVWVHWDAWDDWHIWNIQVVLDIFPCCFHMGPA